ncbi:hypothetical protein L1887_62643 [Cichorium endivia]|nr:hypothetical protein L1887_62643 [Cichorium endivia]
MLTSREPSGQNRDGLGMSRVRKFEKQIDIDDAQPHGAGAAIPATASRQTQSELLPRSPSPAHLLGPRVVKGIVTCHPVWLSSRQPSAPGRLNGQRCQQGDPKRLCNLFRLNWHCVHYLGMCWLEIGAFPNRKFR